jgi:trehalose synthase
MLDHVDLAPLSIDDYEPVVGREVIEELRRLAAPLKGARVAHVNATAYGGGVSELLRSLVPMYRGLGIEADWKLISGDAQFFEVTKGLHNGLQGATFELTPRAREIYLMHNMRNAQQLEEPYDIVVVHDPQPAAMRAYKDDSATKWVWRCHIDTSSPNLEALGFIDEFISAYDALVFTSERFVPPGLEHGHVAIISPAIDPLSPKNMPLSDDLCRGLLSWSGVDYRRPLLTQVSRFDPWKDPMGVLEVYGLLRPNVAGLQLALIGSMALDDPQGWQMYNDIVARVKGDDDIHVRTNIIGVSDVAVNAFQRWSDVVIQKSIREGFGLVVSETLWKGTPVVANRAGGIPLQMDDGVGGFLVESTEECVERAFYLFEHPDEAKEMGEAGKARVREKFLMTRLAADELRLLAGL